MNLSGANVSELGVLAWSQFCQITLLIGIVVILQHRCLARKPQWSGMLWLIVLVKCITPPLLASPTSLFSWAQVRVAPIAYSDASQTTGSDLFSLSGTTVVGWLSSPPVVLSALVVWLTGSICLVVSWYIRWKRLQREVNRARSDDSVTEMADRLASEIGLQRKVAIRVSDQQLGPAVLGVRRPVIVLPTALVEELHQKDLEPLLVHELMHVKRNDTLLGALQIAAAAVWWFHPLVWLAIRRANTTVERCVDAAVVSDLRYSPRRYVQGMIAVLESRCQLNPLAGVPGVRSHEVTRERISDILSADAKRTASARRRWATGIALGLVLLPGASLSIPTQWIVEARDYSNVDFSCSDDTATDEDHD